MSIVIKMVTGEKYYDRVEETNIGAYLNNISGLLWVIVNDSTALKIDNIASIKGN